MQAGRTAERALEARAFGRVRIGEVGFFGEQLAEVHGGVSSWQVRRFVTGNRSVGDRKKQGRRNVRAGHWVACWYATAAAGGL